MWRTTRIRVQNDRMIRVGFLRAVLAAAVMVAAGRAAAEVVDEIVAKVNEDIVTKADLESEEQGALQELYRQYSGAELDTRVAQAKREMLRHLIDRRVLVQRAGHLFDLTKMQDFFLASFKENQNIKSDKELEKLLLQQNMTMADLKTRLLEDAAPQQVIRAEIVERIAVSEKDERDYYDAHPEQFEIPAESTVREIVIKSTAADRDAKRAEAEAARSRAAAPGADFAAIAAEVSDAGTKKQGGLLGTVKKGDLSAALDHAAFSVAVGEISPVIEADYGFHILKVDSRIEQGAKPFDSAKDEIETKLRAERYPAEYRTYLKKAWAEATIWISPKYQDRLSSDEVAN